MRKLLCRFCDASLNITFCDLGMSPLANSYLDKSKIDSDEEYYPLHVYGCQNCHLVQLPEHENPKNIFSNYLYYSSYSSSWLEHSKKYVCNVIERFNYNKDSMIIEIASNDGYLLQYFKEYDVPVLGIEPAMNVAAVAANKGIDTINEFFGVITAKKLVAKGKNADLIIGNNVLAHVPNIKDFVAGMSILLGKGGVITMEFPHLLKLVNKNQFDTIYHEHYSYLSLHVVKKIFEKFNLKIFDVDELMTHGGSLRIYACHSQDENRTEGLNVATILNMEKEQGLFEKNKYNEFYENVKITKKQILDFLKLNKEKGASIIAYGAAAKGNTLLNYCNIKSDTIDYIVDLNPYKQGKYMPGSHIPIFPPETILKTKPDFILILPWNIKEEIINQIAYIREWGGKFIVPIPELKIL